MTRLMGMHFKIVYIQGKESIAADALSRVAHMMAMQAVSTIKPTWVQEILNSYAADPQAQQMLAKLAIVNLDATSFSLEQGLIKHKGNIWIEQNLALQTKLIAAFHSSPLGDIQEFLPHITRSRNIFLGKDLSKMWRVLSNSVLHVSKLNILCNIQWDYYSHYPFPREFGEICQWILLRVCQNQRDTVSYWW